MAGRQLCVLLMCIAALPLVCQNSAPKYQQGTVLAVDRHKSGDADKIQYDVSIKVGATKYVILFTPVSGSNRVEYAVGMVKLVLVGSDTLTFADALGKTTVAPILQREALPAQSTIDWTQAPGKYYSMKLQNLSEKLNLSADQQTSIKPILEQEAGEASEIVANPVLSRKDKLNRLEEIIRSSDKKLKPFLSAEQWLTLQNMRKDQKQELKQLTADKKEPAAAQ